MARMTRSLGFAAYRAFSRRISRTDTGSGQPRPGGELLWLHNASGNRIAALRELGKRVQSQRDDLSVLITSFDDLPGPAIENEPGIRYDRILLDHPSEMRRFLDHWHPDMCLWAGAGLKPNLISQTSERNIPMVLIDVARNDFPSRNHKWFPDLTRECLGRFETIMTTGPGVSAMLLRIGIPKAKITTGEPLRNGPSPDPVDEQCLTETSQQLAGRPVWHSTCLQASEIDPILSAHRIALRLIHRLLLVVTVAGPDVAGPLGQALTEAGLRHAFWRSGDNIDDNTQVLVCEAEEDQGVWFRMAPLTFMASSLGPGDRGCDPMEAVALGSAILFGPHVGDQREKYSRLAAAGAAKGIRDAEDLGAEVIRLVAPDQAAAMALEGWRIVTESAAVTDHLVNIVQDHLDNAALAHARP